MQIISHSPSSKTNTGVAVPRIARLVLTAALLLAVPIPLLDKTAAEAGLALLAVVPVLLPVSGFELSAALLLACFLVLGFSRPADGSWPRRAVIVMVATILVHVPIPLLGASALVASADLLGRMAWLIPQDGGEVAAAFALALLAVTIAPASRRS